MDRRAAAQAFSTAAAFGLALHAEAEAELASAREEAAQLRAALAQERAARVKDAEAYLRETTDYERTVSDLRAKLRDEEARRARYQAGYSAAVRFVRRFRAENPESGWQAGWRCPTAEMRDLLAAVPDDFPPGA